MVAPDFRVDGRVALVTGAGRGIGLAMARALAACGAAVAIQDIELDIARAEADAINSAGGRAVAIGGDLTELSLPARVIDETVAQLGGLHILINNGSIQKHQHWLEQNADEFKRQIDADLVSPVLFAKLAVPHMRKAGWGRIINIGSIQQRSGNTHMLPYSLSKACMEKLTVALARDLAKDGITVNCIAPGWINTWRNRDDFRDEQDKIEKGKRVPLGRVGEPEDFAGIVVLLCSAAGSYITGQNIYVDGGLSTW